MGTDLWMVIAVIPQFRLDTVTRALEDVPGFNGMTVTDCRGFGHERLGRETDAQSAPGIVYDLGDFKPRVKLEAAVAGRAVADALVAAVARSARTGRGGDGKIFLVPIAHAVRVRTMTYDREAL